MLENEAKRLEYSSNFGILTFLVIYYIASGYYPGGTNINPQTIGFDWTQNYWCDLLNTTAVNGNNNPARILALVGHLFLCSSLILFYSQFASKMANGAWKLIIRNSGILSIICAFFIFTDYHDFFIGLSSAIGLPALLGITIIIRQSNLTVLKYLGILCLLLFFLNNAVYYSNLGLYYLPLIQKTTFIVVFNWVFCANWHLMSFSKAS